MKKIFLSTALIVLGVVGSANAGLYTEEYTGNQSVHEGQTYHFGFDMWYDNQDYDVGTTAREMELTKDAVGATENWFSAKIEVDLFSGDKHWEETTFTLGAWDRKGTTYFDLGTYGWNGWKNKTDTVKSFSFEFDQEQLSAFEREGWGSLSLTATVAKDCNFNDFIIERVGMAVNTTAPVPEPSTMLLFGAGAMGLIGYSRKRSNKKA